MKYADRCVGLGIFLVALWSGVGRAETGDIQYVSGIASLRVWAGVEYSTLVGREEGDDSKKLFSAPSSYVSINQSIELDREPDHWLLRRLQPEEFQAQLRFGTSGLETGKAANAVTDKPGAETITEADLASLTLSALWYFRKRDKFEPPLTGEHRFLSYLRADGGRSVDVDEPDNQQTHLFAGAGLRVEGQYISSIEFGWARDERFDDSPERSVIRGHWFYRSPRVEKEQNKEQKLFTLGLLYAWSKALDDGEDETTVGVVAVSDLDKLLGKFL